MDVEQDTNVLEQLTNLESTFFKQGYESGYHHGKLHGTFEGRALGQEKGFEIWEEVGYIEGWAEFWVERLGDGTSVKRNDVKALTHAKQLLSLISKFPTTNPSSTLSNPENEAQSNSESTADLSNLLSLIRARYRLLCSSLGTRPRLMVSSGADDVGSQGGDGEVEGVEGPMKGVDARQLKF